MYLERLELHGFKTFAKKTELRFASEKEKSVPITAVIGPNGSGKSNVADAIRWVLGEQSLKLLRGKESQDVIFSGAEGSSRGNLAEVTMSLHNSKPTESFPEAKIEITRRLYRDGSSEYLMNGSIVRLADINLFLAEAQFGQKSYGVIGQGMIDHILSAPPHERKLFFDDAAGVKSLHLKKHQASLKLRQAEEKMREAELTLRELTPRVESLARQVERLKSRDGAVQALDAAQKEYFRAAQAQLEKQRAATKTAAQALAQATAHAQSTFAALSTRFAAMEKQSTEDAGLAELQKSYQELLRHKSKLEHEKFDVERTLAVSRVKAEKPFTPLPLSKIIAEVAGIVEKLQAARAALDKNALPEAQKTMQALEKQSQSLLAGLQKPADDKPKEDDPKLLKEMERLAQALLEVQELLTQKEGELNNYSSAETVRKSELFQVQRELQKAQRDLMLAESKENEARIQEARVDAKEESLKEEWAATFPQESMEVLQALAIPQTHPEELRLKVNDLRKKVEQIGMIEPGVPEEYALAKSRHDDLTRQLSDVQKAALDTKAVMKELEAEIKERSQKMLKELNSAFQKYFQKIFGGGDAAMTEILEEIDEESLSLLSDEEREEAKKNRGLAGVEIHATPPGKKPKSINLLSGGERAMTAIALIAAIISLNPAPFVVLDEVDAALDEANSRRYAEILKELAKNTQLIVITHNRTTMEAAQALYGVTMQQGISQLLSVKLEDAISARQ